MTNGEMKICIGWGNGDKTGITVTCGNCHQIVDVYLSDNIFCVPVKIHRNCPKCGAKFNQIIGEMK